MCSHTKRKVLYVLYTANMLSHCVNIGLKQILTYSELQLRNVLGTLQAVKGRSPLERQVGLHTLPHCLPYSLTRSHRILICTCGCTGTIQYHLPNPIAILSTSSVALKTYNNDLNKTDKAESTSDKNKTKKDSPMIILIDTEDKVSVISLSQAEKIARRRDLKVVKIEDSSLKTSDKQVYKLMTGKQYFDEEVKAKKNFKSPFLKGEKVLTISSKIAAHDLKSKQKKIKMWLEKGYQIRVTITSRGTENKDAENIFAAIEEEINNKGRILQQRVKAGNFKFSIVPPKVEQTADKEAKIHDEENHAASGALDNSQVVDSNQESSELTKS